MATIRVEAVLYIESDEDAEEVCGTFDAGLESALSTFPAGEVLHAEVESGRLATADEIREFGLDEM